MPTRLLSGAAVRLLAVMCVTAGCVAEQQQPSAGVYSSGPYIDRYIEQRMWPELRSFVSSLEMKIDALVSRLDTQKSQLDGLAAKVDDQKSQLNGQKSELESLTSRLGRQESQLTRLGTELDSQQSQLAVLTDTSSSEQSRLDRAANKTASQQTQIDELAVRLDKVESEGGPRGSEPLPRDCSELSAGARSGIYLLEPGLDRPQLPVVAYCDLVTDGGKWTVFQRRANIEPHQDFYLGWAAYKEGFGQLRGEFWWGLEKLWRMTSEPERQYQLRIDLESFEGEKRHALYQNFRISSEKDGYRLLSVENYTGDAGDSLSWSVNSTFLTRDRDQNGWWSELLCTQYRNGAWWYGDCADSTLNGLYLNGPAVAWRGIWWNRWNGHGKSLKKAEMKLRRV